MPTSFSNFKVKVWESWMTECVLLSASGVTMPELRLRFGVADNYIQNVLDSAEAQEILDKTKRNIDNTAAMSNKELMASSKRKILIHIDKVLENDKLAEERPLAFWDAARKTLETLSREEKPVATPVAASQNNQMFQQNIFNASPEMIDRLRNAPSLVGVEVPRNVQFTRRILPTDTDAGRGVGVTEKSGEIAGTIHGGRISTP